jgi:hypothetical protein
MLQHKEEEYATQVIEAYEGDRSPCCFLYWQLKISCQVT